MPPESSGPPAREAIAGAGPEIADRLRALVEDGGDERLERARRIGESALEAGTAIADLVELQRRALEDAAARGDEAGRRRMMKEAPAVLRALLAPFEASVKAGRAARAEIAEARREAQRRADAETAARRELESFAYSVSHDLRAPLRTIDGFTQVLLEDHADKLDAQGKEYIDYLRASAVRLGKLIDGLGSLTRVGRKEMSWEPVDLGEIAAAVAGRLRTEHPERRVDFVVEDGLRAQGDPELLEALLEELIGNAWKFTARRDVARVEFGRRAPDGGQPVFYVRDNGAGFDMRYASNLFGVFQRLHRVSDFEGTGIGLALAQRIVRRHGGRITAEAEVDRGATLSFTLGTAAA